MLTLDKIYHLLYNIFILTSYEEKAMSEKSKKSIRRSPWRVITLLVIILGMVAAMVLSYIFMTGGDRPEEDVGDNLVTDDLWSKTLAYAAYSENKATLKIEDSLILLDNGLMSLELDKTSPYLSKVFGAESGRVLFHSLPTVKMETLGREFTLSGTEWTVPVNTAYTASAAFDASLTAQGREEEFVALKTFTINDKNTLADWSMILGGCKLKLVDGAASLTVDGSASPYFGAGDLDIDVTSIPEGAVGCVRLKLKGSGVSSVEVNYSAVYDNIRLQGVAEKSLDLGEDWVYVTVPVTDGSFVGEIYTLYFRLSASLDATLTLASVEVGYIDSFKAPVGVSNLCTVYADRYIPSSSIYSTAEYTPDLLWAETVIPAEELSQIEAVSGTTSAYYKPANITLENIDYTVFHFVSGEAVMLLPTSEAATGRLNVTVTEDGRVIVKQFLDPTPLATAGGEVNISYRMEYASSDIRPEFAQSYNEENRLLTEADVKVTQGSFGGYDPFTGRYMFMCQEGSASLSLTSKDSRYVYLEFLDAEEYVSFFNGQSKKLPLNLMGGEGCVVGIYLEAGEEMTFTLNSLADEGLMTTFLDGIGYTNSAGKEIGVEFTSAEYICCSELYTEVKYIGATDDGAADVILTLAAFTDGDRPVYIYDLDISFKRRVSLSTLTENLCLFSFEREGKTGLYYTDVSDGVSFKSSKDMDEKAVFSLSAVGPAIATLTQDGYALGLVASSYSSTANITPLSSLLHGGYNENVFFLSGTGDLTAKDSGNFGLGDHIRLRGFISTSADESAEELISRIKTAYGNGYITVAERGTVEDGVIPTVKLSSSGNAVFNLRGGTQTLPIKVEGLRGYTFPSVKVNGQPYVPTHYSLYMDEGGTVGFVFDVPCGSRVEVVVP